MSVVVTRRSLLEGSFALGAGSLLSGCLRRGPEGETPSTTPEPALSRLGCCGVSTASALTALEPARLHLAPSAPMASEAAAGVPALVKTIYIQPLGERFSGPELEYVEAALRLYFPFPIRRLPEGALPQQAYYPPRRRYRAERLLEHLEQHTPGDAQVMMGLTEVDISTTKGAVYDWGILGLATLSGQQCVISSFRAKRDSKSSTHAKERLAKTVVHEVGHTIGLPHCPNYGCIMEDGKGSVTTTDHERDICAACRARVGGLMLPVPAALPW